MPDIYHGFESLCNVPSIAMHIITCAVQAVSWAKDGC